MFFASLPLSQNILLISFSHVFCFRNPTVQVHYFINRITYECHKNLPLYLNSRLTIESFREAICPDIELIFCLCFSMVATCFTVRKIAYLPNNKILVEGFFIQWRHFQPYPTSHPFWTQSDFSNSDVRVEKVSCDFPKKI